MTMRRTARWLARAAAAAALVTLPGCDRIGNPFMMFGERPPAPDEFQVLAREPLRMPGSAALPEPRPGAPSPLDPDPNRDAVVALMGEAPAPRAEPAGDGEAALLSAANTQSSQPGIRGTLEAERDRQAAGEPYEPPTIFELLGVGEAPPEDAIDATAEARRLQREGIAPAPVDPEDRPAPPPRERDLSHGDPRIENRLPTDADAPFD